MGRVRCVAVIVLWSLCVVSSAVAETPFERPANAVGELAAERTPVSRTWELASGEHVTQIASAPVQWRDEHGDWHDFDLGLRQSQDGWHADAGPMAIDLPSVLDGSGDGAVRLGLGGESLAMTLLGGSASGSVTGEEATYRGALDGVDVRFRAIPEGLKEDVVLHGRDSARDLAYRLELGKAGATVSEGPQGGLRIERDGTLLFQIPAPVPLTPMEPCRAMQVSLCSSWTIAVGRSARSWMTSGLMPVPVSGR